MVLSYDDDIISQFGEEEDDYDDIIEILMLADSLLICNTSNWVWIVVV